jgi:ketosteroid isomerase-like protein
MSNITMSDIGRWSTTPVLDGANLCEGYMSTFVELQNVMSRMASAYTLGDATACAQMFTNDGELHSPYAPPARGRQEIEALHRIWTEGEVDDKALTVVQAGGSENLAWCLATYSEQGGKYPGTSLCVFERQETGEWLIRICSLNGIEAADV